MVSIAAEAPGFRIGFEQAVNGLGLDPRLLAHALGGAAGGRCEQKAHSLGRENAQDGVEQCGFTDAGAAGDHSRFGIENHADRGALRRGESLARALLDPWNGLVDIDRRPGRRAAYQGAQPIGDAAFGEIQAPQEHAGLFFDRVRHHIAAGELIREGSPNGSLIDFEQRRRQLDQLLDGETAMTFVCRLLQGVGNSGPHPLRGLPRHAKLHGDGVGGPKADAANVARQPIRILGHDLNGVMAIGLEDAHGSGRADAVRVQEDHDVAHGFLLGPAGDNLPCPEFADAGNLAHAPRLRLDNLEGLLAESRDDPFGEHGADPAHHARAEIFFDSLRRRWRRGLEKVRLELEAVSAVGDPNPDGVDEFARRDRSNMADDGNKVALAARLHLQHGEAVVLIVEGHPLDRADERLSGRRRVKRRGQAR